MKGFICVDCCTMWDWYSLSISFDVLGVSLSFIHVAHDDDAAPNVQPLDSCLVLCTIENHMYTQIQNLFSTQPFPLPCPHSCFATLTFCPGDAVMESLRSGIILYRME